MSLYSGEEGVLRQGELSSLASHDLDNRSEFDLPLEPDLEPEEEEEEGKDQHPQGFNALSALIERYNACTSQVKSIQKVLNEHKQSLRQVECLLMKEMKERNLPHILTDRGYLTRAPQRIVPIFTNKRSAEFTTWFTDVCFKQNVDPRDVPQRQVSQYQQQFLNEFYPAMAIEKLRIQHRPPMLKVEEEEED